MEAQARALGRACPVLTAAWLRYLKAADQPPGAPGHPGPLRGQQRTVGSRCLSSKGLVGKEGCSAAGRPVGQAPGREGEPPRVEQEPGGPGREG